MQLILLFTMLAMLALLTLLALEYGIPSDVRLMVTLNEFNLLALFVLSNVSWDGQLLSLFGSLLLLHCVG